MIELVPGQLVEIDFEMINLTGIPAERFTPLGDSWEDDVHIVPDDPPSPANLPDSARNRARAEIRLTPTPPPFRISFTMTARVATPVTIRAVPVGGGVVISGN